MQTRVLNVGLVGLGYWGPNLLRVLMDMEATRVSRICDLDATRLAQFARRYPGAEPTVCFHDLLEDDSLDAIVLATPVYTHFDLASRSLAAGKHTFVEKPLAPSSEQVQTLLDAAAAADVVLMTGQTFLYSPPVRAVKEILARGELGDLYFISSSRVNLGLHQRDVSVVWDLGPHDFSILLYWLEETPESIITVRRSLLGASQLSSTLASVPELNRRLMKTMSGIPGTIESRPTAMIDSGVSCSQ